MANSITNSRTHQLLHRVSASTNGSGESIGYTLVLRKRQSRGAAATNSSFIFEGNTTQSGPSPISRTHRKHELVQLFKTFHSSRLLYVAVSCCLSRISPVTLSEVKLNSSAGVDGQRTQQCTAVSHRICCQRTWPCGTAVASTLPVFGETRLSSSRRWCRGSKQQRQRLP